MFRLFSPFVVFFLALMALLYFRPNTLATVFYVVVVLFLNTALLVLLDWVKKGKGYVIASRANYIFWVLFDVAVSIVVGLYYLLSHHPVIWLVALPLIAICVPLVVSKYRQLGYWCPN